MSRRIMVTITDIDGPHPPSTLTVSTIEPEDTAPILIEWTGRRIRTMLAGAVVDTEPDATMDAE